MTVHIKDDLTDMVALTQLQSRRALFGPQGGGWTEEENEMFDWILPTYISMVPKARLFHEHKRKKAEELGIGVKGRVTCVDDPLEVWYRFGETDPWDRGGWWEGFANPAHPLSPRALVRYFVMKNMDAGVNLLWMRADDPGTPVGPINGNSALGKWCPKEGPDGWTSPLGVWEMTAGLTFPEIVALAHQLCWENDEFREVISDFYWDMPGWNHLWSSWPASAHGMPKWGEKWPDHYYSPIPDGTHEYMDKIANIDGFRYMTNQYGNGPGWGNYEQFKVRPIGHKFETELDQYGFGRIHDSDELQPYAHWEKYWDRNRNRELNEQNDAPADQSWPNWRSGYFYAAQNVHSTNICMTVARDFDGQFGPKTQAYRRWCLGTALLMGAFVSIHKAWSNYSAPTYASCPEYYEWMNDVPASGFEKRELTKNNNEGRHVYLRAYQARRKRNGKRLVVVNPHLTKSTGGVPPQDAVYLKLDEMTFREQMNWNNMLQGLEVNSDPSTQPAPIEEA